MFLTHYKKALFHFFAMMGLLSLTACSTLTDLKTDISDKVFGRESADAPDPLVEIKETASSKLVWQAKVGAAEDFEFSPVIEAGFAYAAGAAGDIVKLDVVTGKQAWRVNAGEKLSGGVGVGGSLVMVGTQKGVVYACLLYTSLPR